MCNGIYVMDHDTEISDAYNSIEELLEAEDTSNYEYIHIKVNGEMVVLQKGVHY